MREDIPGYQLINSRFMNIIYLFIFIFLWEFDDVISSSNTMASNDAMTGD
jgi:hypothetical protein